MKTPNNKMYVVTVDMGYGHQRATYPFAANAQDGIILANKYPGIKDSEAKLWQSQRKIYEIISYFKKLPLLGSLIFSIMDEFQEIDPFYPRRNLSKKITQQKFFFNLVKKGVGKELVNSLNQKPLPLLTSFFVPVYFSEYYHYKGQVYCIVCDADISRSWAPIKPQKSRTIYLAPTRQANDRLIMYGVNPKQIKLTGFPLPKENVGGPSKRILKSDLGKRLARLDPNNIFRAKYAPLLEAELGAIPADSQEPITVTYAVGGAGAQREIAGTILASLKDKLIKGQVKLNLVAGVRQDVDEYFQAQLGVYNLTSNKNVKVIFHQDKVEYFKLFNQALKDTDILWTKPSELSFYAGLGLPLLLTDPVGSQEHFNREWLMSIGASIDDKDPKYTSEWLFDWLQDGRLARLAWNGYLEAPTMGTYNIEKLILNK